MRRAVLITVVLFAAGAFGALIRSVFTGESTDAPASVREEIMPRTDAAPAPVVIDLSDRLDAISRRLKEVEEHLRLLRQENADRSAELKAAQEVLLARLSERAAAVGHRDRLETPPDESPRAVEEIRTKWRAALADVDRRLDEMLKAGADPNEIIMWGRLDDVKKARVSLEAATDMKALRLLAKQYKSYFQIESEGR